MSPHDTASGRTFADLLSTDRIQHSCEWSLEGLQGLTWLPRDLPDAGWPCSGREWTLISDSITTFSSHHLSKIQSYSDLSPLCQARCKQLSQNISASLFPLKLHHSY